MVWEILSDGRMGDLDNIETMGGCKTHPELRIDVVYDQPSRGVVNEFLQIRYSGKTPLQVVYTFFSPRHEPTAILMHLVRDDLRWMNPQKSAGYGCFTEINEGWTSGQEPGQGANLVHKDFVSSGQYIHTGLRYHNTTADLISYFLQTEAFSDPRAGSRSSGVVPPNRAPDVFVYDKNKERLLPVSHYVQKGTWRPTEWGGG